ncbi:hypothetical protein BV20DRAFT_421596 [Pilatotrama ljubarskyi]|nr:hypothetical protein BV20DRAFT_421596 [Pilatotrama ljubarskyi]
MNGKIVIIPIEEMLDTFVPLPAGQSDPLEQLSTLNFSAVATTPEAAMYDPLMSALNHEWLLPDDVLVATPYKPDSNVRSKQKIDGGMYHRGDAPIATERTRWSSIELSIECKTKPVQDDPFEDDTNKGGPEATSIARKKNRGQLMSYAVLVFENQHRTHHFTLVILGSKARIIRWDRSGVIVSKKFDYIEKPVLLGKFIWRYARMTPDQRGHDMTAERLLPGSADYKDMLARASASPDDVAVGKHAHEMFVRSLDVAAPWWRLRVDDAKGTRYFLVGVPHFKASGLAGRGTRGYVAIDADDKDGPFVFLKDAWRVAHDRIVQEGKTLQRLNDDGNGGPVRGVPTLLCHGDVEQQTTVSQVIWRKMNPGNTQCPLKTHRHYRLVVKEVGISMSNFVNSYELVLLLCMCIDAHHQAYTRKGIIHRDISAGNVLIYPMPVTDPSGKVTEKRVGLLTDWELSKDVNDPQEGPRQPDRTGTWQFMSASSLMDASKRIIVADEMESYFHLLLYFCIRFLPHNCHDVGAFMDKYFDGHEKENDVYYVGEKKLTSMLRGEILARPRRKLRFFLLSPGEQQRYTKVSVRATISAASSSTGTSQALIPSPPIIPRTSHPINYIFDALLACFKAHYTVFKPEEPEDPVTPFAASPEVPSTPQGAMLQSIGAAGLDFYSRFHKTPVPDSSPPMVPPATSPPTPTQQELEEEMSEEEHAHLLELAAILTDQEKVLALVAQTQMDHPLPQTVIDRVDDQLDPKYRRKNETYFQSKRTMESSQYDTEERLPGKRSRSMR